jgi:hypothetical protein
MSVQDATRMPVRRENDSPTARIPLGRPLGLGRQAVATAIAATGLNFLRLGRLAGSGTIGGACRAPILERGLCSLAIATLCLVFSTGDCFAYVDPNLGGWLFQLLFPVLVTLGGIWVIVRTRVASLWRRLLRRDRPR